MEKLWRKFFHICIFCKKFEIKKNNSFIFFVLCVCFLLVLSSVILGHSGMRFFFIVDLQKCAQTSLILSCNIFRRDTHAYREQCGYICEFHVEQHILRIQQKSLFSCAARLFILASKHNVSCFFFWMKINCYNTCDQGQFYLRILSSWIFLFSSFIFKKKVDVWEFQHLNTVIATFPKEKIPRLEIELLSQYIFSFIGKKIISFLYIKNWVGC